MLELIGITRDFQNADLVSLICNGIGVLGFMLYLTSYTLVTFQRIDSRGVLFFFSEYGGGVCCTYQSDTEL